MIQKKLLIVDSSLQNYSGHNYFYNYKIIKVLNKNFKINILANKNIKIKSKFVANIEKYFEDYFEIKQNKFFRILKTFNFLKKLTFIRYIYDKKIKYINKSNINNLSLYKKKIYKIFKRKTDFIFFHSETGNKFQDIVSVLLFSTDCITNKNILIVDRIGTFQNKSIIQIIKYLSFKKNIFFLTDSINIIKNYEKNKISIKLLPLFPQFSDGYNKERLNKSLNISLYVGPARKEKGFMEIPCLLEKFRQIKKITFDLNYSLAGNSFDKNEINSLFNQLSKFDVHIKKIAMTNEQYVKYFQGIDVLIMNYKSNIYKEERTSTIFLDAITNFVIPIVKKDTWMSSLIKDNQILNKLIIKNNNEIVNSIHFIQNNKVKILNEIKHFRSNVLKINNPNNLKDVFKITDKIKKPYKTLLYINKNFLLEQDNTAFLSDNFYLVKKYNYKDGYLNIINLINKILLDPKLSKRLDVTKILYEKNYEENLSYEENFKIGLFKLDITKKKPYSPNYNKLISKFLFTNNQTNTVYTLMKIK